MNDDPITNPQPRSLVLSETTDEFLRDEAVRFTKVVSAFYDELNQFKESKLREFLYEDGWIPPIRFQEERDRYITLQFARKQYIAEQKTFDAPDGDKR
jgi:hypothetical protein